MLRKLDVFLRAVDNRLSALLQGSLELKDGISDFLTRERIEILTNGMTSAGSFVSLWASSSLYEIKCAMSMSQ